MELIFGGAYQGKLDYATEKYDTMDIYHCRKDVSDPAFDRMIIDALEEFVYACVKDGVDPVEYLKEKDEVISSRAAVIVKDISLGLTPSNPVMREWRRQNSLTMDQKKLLKLPMNILNVRQKNPVRV